MSFWEAQLETSNIRGWDWHKMHTRDMRHSGEADKTLWLWRLRLGTSPPECSIGRTGAPPRLHNSHLSPRSTQKMAKNAETKLQMRSSAPGIHIVCKVNSFPGAWEASRESQHCSANAYLLWSPTRKVLYAKRHLIMQFCATFLLCPLLGCLAQYPMLTVSKSAQME